MSPQERAKRIAETARANSGSEREKNRREMPETARILDELRSVFGKPSSFRFQEAGRVVEWP